MRTSLTAAKCSATGPGLLSTRRLHSLLLRQTPVGPSLFHKEHESMWIALFRGINVGGNKVLPMAKLRSDLEALKVLAGSRAVSGSSGAIDSA